MYTIMPEPRLPASQGRASLSDQHESGVVSKGNCGGDVYGAVDQQAAIAIAPGPAENAVASGHAQPADTATAAALDTAMRARSRGRTKDESTSRAHQSSMHRTVASAAKSATPAPAAPDDQSGSRLSTTLTGAAAMLDTAICPSQPSGDRIHIATK